MSYPAKKGKSVTADRHEIKQKTLLWRMVLMILKQVLEIYDLLDSSTVSGEKVKELFQKHQWDLVTVNTIEGEEGSTDFVKIIIPGKNGKI